MYCGATAGELVTVAEIPTGDGTGRWTSYACRPCRIGGRLVPFLAHPSGSRGGLHYWPAAVPYELVARLADLGDAPQLRPITDRLFPAVAASASRVVAGRDRGAATSAVHAAVMELRKAAVTDTDDRREPVHLFTSRLFPGGGGDDDTTAAAEWTRSTLDAHGLSAAWPVADAMITAGRTRRPWWLSLRADEDAVAIQIHRSRAHRTPRLPDPIPGLANGVRHAYSVTPVMDGLCMWASVALSTAPPPSRDEVLDTLAAASGERTRLPFAPF